MKDSITLELSLEHIHDDLIDIECEVELDLYTSKTGDQSDDPSEIEIVSVKCTDETSPALFGQYINLTEDLEEQIIRQFNGNASHH